MLPKMLIYCLHCRKRIHARNVTESTTANGRKRVSGTCPQCKNAVSRFVSATKQGGAAIQRPQIIYGEGLGDIMNAVDKYVPEMHIPGYNFAGPFTKLGIRLNADRTPKAWSKPINRVDEACYRHDLKYAERADTAWRLIADRELLAELDAIPNPTAEERAARALIKRVIGAKIRFGL
jgi:hypothetical protein